MAQQNEQDGAGQQGEGFFNSMARTMLIVLGVNLLTRQMFGNNGPQQSGSMGTTGGDNRDEMTPLGRMTARRDASYANAWTGGESLALAAYVSTRAELGEEATRLWTEDELWNDDAGMSRAKRFEFGPEHAVVGAAWRNETVYAHAVLGRRDVEWIGCSNSTDCVVASAPLTRHFAPVSGARRRSLLGGDREANATVDEHSESTSKSTALLYWKPTLRVRLAVVPMAVTPDQVPSHMAKAIRFRGQTVLPILEIDEFWLTRKSLVGPLNSSVPALPLEASLGRVHFFKWNLQKTLDQHWETQIKLGLAKDGESDMIREILADTNPWLLATTAVVSVLHMVFETLTLRSNVKFWRNKKNLVGLSARTIAFHCFTQLVVLLYLLDNETNWTVVVSNVLALGTELWKLTKAVSLVRHPETGRLSIKFEDAYAQSSTREYDRVATSHLAYGAVPLAVGFSAYSLVNSTHKGWYSWLISSTVTFIYLFGFLAMTPQLYINYKLKSVAHLPWKAMTYKALNTFIDDLMVLIIKQPFLHRLACLRDDVIFFATLYQRYLYGVDMSRVNEFGGGGLDHDDGRDSLRGGLRKQQQPLDQNAHQAPRDSAAAGGGGTAPDMTPPPIDPIDD